MSVIKNIKLNKKKHFGFLDQNNKKVLSRVFFKIKFSAHEKQNKNRAFLISDNKAFSNKQIEENPLFVWSKKKQNLKTIGKKLITKKIKKRRYRYIKQLKKLEIRYDLNKYRLSKAIKVFSKLKHQKSSASKSIKKLKLRISRLLKHKHQSEKFKTSIIILKRLRLFRRKTLVKIAYIIHKKHLYAHYINEVEKKKEIENKKFYKPKNKKSKAKPFYGVLKVLTIKRNIFITLSDIKGNVRATVSSGLLKVKGRKRQALHIVKATAQKIISLIFKHRMLKLFVFFRGRTYRKKKTLTQIFSKVKKFEFLKINRPARRCHNGCRSSKKRRK